MKITPVSELVARASEQIVTVSAGEAIRRQAAGDAILVDLRDIRELDREGRVDGALHVPRGMLEFWFDPSSPYHKESLANSGKTYVLFCAAGWRSALSAKTLGDMGFENIAHVDGGFGALKQAGGRIVGKDG